MKTKIQELMTTMPCTVGKDISLKKASEIMREHNIRHLPVLANGKLIGILSDRDLKLAAALVKNETIQVEEAMSPDPYSVSPDTSLLETVKTMAEHKYGCVVIQNKSGHVLGIFTANDGLKALAQKLDTN